MAKEELEGNTLSVYAYIVQADKPVGTRDVTRGANLSSTSVAHRHLQKLEDFGLIGKNEYGEYVLKEKTSVKGYVWVGRTLVPRLMFYSLFFLGALTAEIGIFLVSIVTGAFAVDASFIFLVGMTLIALAMFLFESISMSRKITDGHSKKNAEENEESP